MKKLLGVLIALFVINTMVQTNAILSLQDAVVNSNQKETISVSRQNMQASVQASLVKQSLNLEDVDGYLEAKYPKDYNEKKAQIADKVAKLVLNGDVVVGEDETTEIRRFLCWVTGGIWIQVGPSRMCQYARDVHFIPDDVRIFNQDDTGVDMFTLINKIITNEKNLTDLYFTNKGLSREEAYSEIQKIFLSENVNKNLLHLNIRRFFCRVFGGVWLEDQTVSVETEHGTVTSTFSSCTY